MARDHKQSHLDTYDSSDDTGSSSAWPGKRALTDQLPRGSGVVRAFGGGAGAEPAAAAIEGKGAGAPLDPGFQQAASRAYGDGMSDVRVHTDSNAASGASKMGAEAFAHGSDVYFGSGKYQPETPQGQFVMMHELAHVAQTRGGDAGTQAKLEVGTSGDAAEVEADTAATAAMEGRAASVQKRAPGGIHKFEAGVWKYDPYNVNKDGNHFTMEPGGHASLTTEALKKMGLSNDEAVKGYQGNWMRDLSQVMVPGLVGKLKEENLLTIMQIISIKDFGQGFDPAEFGTYDPVEHIDNPTDLRAKDVFQQMPRDKQGYPVGTNPDQKIPVGTIVPVPGKPVDVPGQGLVPSGQVDDKGQPKKGAEEGYANDGVDPRYAATAAHENASKDAKDHTINTGDVKAFQVNANGIPTYINTSKEWCIQTLRDSGSLGKDDPKGPRQFGSGIHTMQDYYAHSNFCEIAVNSLIKSGNFAIPEEDGKTVSKIKATDKIASKVEANNAKGDPKTMNLTVKQLPGYAGQPNADREVVSTGSFNLTDTAVSLLAVVKEKVTGMNPFADKSSNPSPLVTACLDYIDMAKPDGFNAAGKKIAAVIRPLGELIKTAGKGASSVVKGAGDIGGGIAQGAGNAGGGAFDLLNKGNAFFGGDPHYWDDQKKSVVGAGQSASNAITGATGDAAAKIEEMTSFVSKKADEIEKREHILRDVYKWMSDFDLLAPLKAMAKAIPVIGPAIAEAIEKTQKAIKDLCYDLLSGLWILASKIIIGKIQNVVDWLTKKTNIENQKKKAGKEGQKAGPDFLPNKVRELLGEQKTEMEKMLGGVGDLYDDQGQPKNGIAPKGFTPPSHSEIAKDHHAKDLAGDKEASLSDKNTKVADPDHPQEGDADVDGGDWMNGLAESLAAATSDKIGAKVKAAWDVHGQDEKTLGKALDGIDAEVNAHFCHPDDCPGDWQKAVTAWASQPHIAARIRREIKAYGDKQK